MKYRDYEGLIDAVAAATKEQEVVTGSSRFFGGGQKLDRKTIKFIDPDVFLAELIKLQEKSWP